MIVLLDNIKREDIEKDEFIYSCNNILDFMLRLYCLWEFEEVFNFMDFKEKRCIKILYEERNISLEEFSDVCLDVRGDCYKLWCLLINDLIILEDCEKEKVVNEMLKEGVNKLEELVKENPDETEEGKDFKSFCLLHKAS